MGIDVGGNTAGTQYDQLNVTGTVALGGATLSLSGTHVPNPAALQSFVIINNDLADAVTGVFAGLAEGAQIALGGGFVYITYQGGDGNDVLSGGDGNDIINDSGTTSDYRQRFCLRWPRQRYPLRQRRR